MNQTCKACNTAFDITELDQRFLDKFEVPPPTHCPSCRHRRRLAFNNELNLYWRTCDKTGDKILSNISPEKSHVVYKPQVWWGDKWDALEYGRDFDFNRPFFEQFHELSRSVPHVSVQNNYLLDENAEYTNYAGSSKNCYLIFHADFNRDCYYGYGVKKCESCVDVAYVFDSELLYECIDCRNCYNVRFSQNCLNCSDSNFLRDCIGCKNCFGCKNLHQKEYYIFNVQHSRQDYERIVRDFGLTSRNNIIKLEQRFIEFCRSLPHRYLRTIQTENSFGDQLFNCRDVTESFDVADMRDGRYCYQIYNGAHDCMDMYQFGLGAELVYEGSIIGYNCHFIRFCHMCNEQVADLTYCQDCYHAHDLFGCFGLRHKSFCILNQQYSEHEYHELRERLISHMKKTGEWGEFFPMSISPFAYNETTAFDYFPVTRAEALKSGLKWKDDLDSDTVASELASVPDDITNVTPEILKQSFRCEVSGKSYRIIQPELAFYQKQGIPPPRRCFRERHDARRLRKNPRQLRHAQCDKCKKNIVTSYQEQPRVSIFCESCYQGAFI